MKSETIIRYWKARCRGGHMGRGHDRELVFYIAAKNAMDAIEYARKMPMVKHSSPTAVSSLIEITKDEYVEGRNRASAYDKYKKQR